jgi:type VI secretion system protein ImpF
MAENISRERLQPSLLDRLTDHAPETGRETFEQQTLGLLQLRQAVLRDLAWLLNTTNMAATEDLTATPLAMKSTINFGVPGLAGNIGTANRLGAIEAGIADAIRAFEPRIRADTLKVRLRPSGDDKPTPSLVFEIRGELWAQPVPQQLFLETSIELETRMAVITDVRGGTR